MQTLTRDYPTSGVNRVLGQAYILITLMMGAASASAWLTKAAGFQWPGGLMGGLLFIGLIMGLSMLQSAFRNSGLGIVIGLGIAGIYGAVFSPMLRAYLAISPDAVYQAALSTAAVTGIMSAYALTTKRSLEGLGNYLLFAAIGGLVTAVLNVWLFQSAGLSLLLSAGFVAIFALYIAFDTQRAVRQPGANYILVGTSLFISIAGLFLNLIQLFGVMED